MERLENNILSIGVKEHGAELASIRRGGREYLWQADKQFWARHSPVLFPFVGSVWNGEYRVDGTVYPMGQHGFARDMEFTLIDKTDHSLRYRLASDAGTLARYPYQFILEIGYTLIGNRVRVSWSVTNPGSSPLPFQIGAHPAFYWPLLSDEQIDGGVEAMRPALEATDARGYLRLRAAATTLPISKITEGGCVGCKSTVDTDADGYLRATVETFGRDALVFEDSLITKVTICDEAKAPYLSVEFTSPLVGIWSPPGKRAPFVCIEPWYGRCDTVRFGGDITERQWEQILAPSQTFEAHYDIIIEP